MKNLISYNANINDIGSLRDFIENIDTPIHICDENAKIVAVNRQLQDLWGDEIESVLNKSRIHFLYRFRERILNWDFVVNNQAISLKTFIDRGEYEESVYKDVLSELSSEDSEEFKRVYEKVNSIDLEKVDMLSFKTGIRFNTGKWGYVDYRFNILSLQEPGGKNFHIAFWIRNEKTEKLSVILFADVINSSIIGNYLSFDEYCETLEDFEKICREVLQKYQEIYKAQLNMEFQIVNHSPGNINNSKNKNKVIYEQTGDELYLNFYGNDENVNIYLVMAVGIARELKIRWLLSETNRERITLSKKYFDLGIGIHIGHTREIRKKHHSGEITGAIGYSIAYGKRVESESRKGRYTKIMLSNKAYQVAVENDSLLIFGERKEFTAKGLSGTEAIYEVEYFNALMMRGENRELFKLMKKHRSGEHQFTDNQLLIEKLFESDYSNFWLGFEIAAGYYYGKKYNEAIRILERILTSDRNNFVAWMMMGYCHFDGAFLLIDLNREQLNKYKIEAFYNKFCDAEYCFKTAIKIDESSYDAAIGLGSLYSSCNTMLKFKDIKEKFYEFKEGTRVRSFANRNFFDESLEILSSNMRMESNRMKLFLFKWFMGREEGFDNNLIIPQYAYDVGWINEEEFKDFSMEDIVMKILSKMKESEQLFYNEGFRAVSLFFIAVFFWEGLGNKAIALELVDRSIEILEKYNGNVEHFLSMDGKLSLMLSQEESMHLLKKFRNIVTEGKSLFENLI